MLLVSLGLFLAGCLGAAFAWSIWSLIAFRVVSGAGGALFPLSFAIIRDEFPPEKVKVGIGLLSAVFGVGGGFGIVLSGVIVDNFSWRLLFLLGSIPVALSIALVHRLRARVADPVSLARRHARRATALRRPALADGGAHRGRGLGLDVAAPARTDRRRGGVLPPLGDGRAALELADGRHEDARAPARAADEHRDDDLGLRALQLLRAPAHASSRRRPTTATASARARRRPACSCFPARSRCSSPGRWRGRSVATSARSGRWPAGC